MLTDADRALCATVPLLAGLSPAQLHAVLAHAHVSSHLAGTVLFSQGDAADRFFVVVQGQVHLFALSADGGQSIIEVIDAVSSFAEAAVFARATFPLNGEARSGTRLVHIPAAPLMALLRDDPALTWAFLDGLDRKRHMLDHEIAQLKGSSPGQRLASFLLGLAGDDGKHPVRLPLPKQILASRMGMTPESLSRALARLKPLGVSCQGEWVVITRPDALCQIPMSEPHQDLT